MSLALIIGPQVGCGQWIIPHNSPSGGYANAQLLISAPEALTSLGQDDAPLFLDARGEDAYQAGHIPGALHIPVNDLNDEEGLLLPPSEVALALGALGISNADDVIIYGEAKTGWGADGRIFWMLEYLGHAGDIQLLNGGVKAWDAQGYALETETNEGAESSYDVDLQRDLLATTEDVQGAIEQGTMQLIDTRSASEYGAGHIPGALFFEWDDSLNIDGTLRHADDLLESLGRQGIDPAAPTITYCELGYRSAHFYVTGRLLGFESIANYDGSWAVWTKEGGAVEVK